MSLLKNAQRAWTSIKNAEETFRKNPSIETAKIARDQWKSWKNYVGKEGVYYASAKKRVRSYNEYIKAKEEFDSRPLRGDIVIDTIQKITEDPSKPIVDYINKTWNDLFYAERFWNYCKIRRRVF